MLAAARASKTDRRERVRNVAILMMLRHTGGRISELLGIKLGTVRSRIHRGRAALRDSLAHRTPRTASRLPSSDVEQGAGLS